MTTKTYTEEEYRKGQAEVLRTAAHDLGWFGAQGNLVHPDTAWAGISACSEALRAHADRIERGEGDTPKGGDLTEDA